MMLLWLCVLLLIQFSFLRVQASIQCGVRQIKVRRLLTNGYDIQPGDYPWHSAIFHLKPKREYVCGGSLISPRAIVTSAHCVTLPNRNAVRNADELLVKLGLYTLLEDTESVQEHSIARATTHEAFTHEAFQNDIALLITQSQINFNSYVHPVCLPKRSFLRSAAPGIVLGWGYTEDMKVANVLRAASAPIVSHRECRESNMDAYSSLLDETMFCAGWRNGTNPCNGDSGGGLFMQTNSGRWILNGIVTVTAANRQNENACSTSDYTVFVDVAKYVTWIDQQLPIRPDNNSGNEHCLEIGRWGGVAWNDAPCNFKLNFICEYVA
uniref:Uncharacterized protein n=1 Tax=Anopheles albimanus TaxID=7167 RepID=A0A182FKG1_ANOAL